MPSVACSRQLNEGHFMQRRENDVLFEQTSTMPSIGFFVQTLCLLLPSTLNEGEITQQCWEECVQWAFTIAVGGCSRENNVPTTFLALHVEIEPLGADVVGTKFYKRVHHAVGGVFAAELAPLAPPH